MTFECDQRDENRYKIVARDDDDEMSKWLIKSSAVNEILASNADMRSRILLEEIRLQDCVRIQAIYGQSCSEGQGRSLLREAVPSTLVCADEGVAHTIGEP